MINKARRAVSIHAPAWGATACPFVFTFVKNVSIHAPAWGATTTRPSSSPQTGFNSRSRVGSDPLSSVTVSAVTLFQFTLPRGERRVVAFFGLGRRGFNSRSRVGSDNRRLCPRRPRRRFNSRSRVGSDPGDLYAVLTWTGVSIHAPAWGATIKQQKLTLFDVFQFTLPRGERLD